MIIARPILTDEAIDIMVYKGQDALIKSVKKGMNPFTGEISVLDIEITYRDCEEE